MPFKIWVRMILPISRNANLPLSDSAGQSPPPPSLGVHRLPKFRLEECNVRNVCFVSFRRCVRVCISVCVCVKRTPLFHSVTYIPSVNAIAPPTQTIMLSEGLVCGFKHKGIPGEVRLHASALLMQRVCCAAAPRVSAAISDPR